MQTLDKCRLKLLHSRILLATETAGLLRDTLFQILHLSLKLVLNSNEAPYDGVFLESCLLLFDGLILCKVKFGWISRGSPLSITEHFFCQFLLLDVEIFVKVS